MNYNKIIILTTLVLSAVGFVATYFIDHNFAKSIISPVLLIILAFVGISVHGNSASSLQSVSESDYPEDEHHSDDDGEITTLYVGNIPYKASEKQIMQHFEDVAKIYSVRLMKDKRTGKKKGFGFIEVQPNVANEVINKKNDSVFMERSLVVRPAKDKVA